MKSKIKPHSSDIAKDARWIWHPASSGQNQYVDFLREFTLPKAVPAASLVVMADSNFVV